MLILIVDNWSLTDHFVPKLTVACVPNVRKRVRRHEIQFWMRKEEIFSIRILKISDEFFLGKAHFLTLLPSSRWWPWPLATSTSSSITGFGEIVENDLKRRTHGANLLPSADLHILDWMPISRVKAKMEGEKSSQRIELDIELGAPHKKQRERWKTTIKECHFRVFRHCFFQFSNLRSIKNAHSCLKMQETCILTAQLAESSVFPDEFIKYQGCNFVDKY